VGKLLAEEQADVLREGVRVLAQALMEAEVTALVGAEPYERSGERAAYRNGFRLRTWDTRVGTLELAIPKVRPGSYFPSLLEPRRRGERALAAVVQEAYVHGVSTRKVDDLMKALGLEGISKSEVSRVCAALDVEVEAFRSRALDGEYPYVWLDATYHKVRHDGRVISMATVAAIGVTADGERQVLGVDAGPAEDEAFWTAFLRGLVARGLRGVRLVISDAHEGLKRAVATVLTGASWQRCRVHFMRNLLARVPKAAREAVAAVVRTIFAQPDHASALAQLRRVVDGVRRRFPDAAALLEDAAEDILAYLHFPKAHRARLHSTNPLERLNKEIKRRSNVVGIFPNRAALLRLVGAVLAEQDDEWAVAERRYFSAESMRTLTEPAGGELAQELIAVVA
jgi:putative transposase